MAKKEKINLDGFDDLSEFDFDFSMPDNQDIDSDNRKASSKVAANAFKGFKSTVASKGFIKNILRKAMPSGIVEGYDTVDRVGGNLRRLYDSSRSELRPAVTDFKRATRNALPLVRKRGQDKLADRIEKMLGAEETRNIRSKYDPEADGANQALLEVFKEEAKDRESREETQDAEQQVKDFIETKRFGDLSGMLNVIARSSSQLAGYERQVTSKWQRKMLELSYRQLYTQRETLGSIQAYVKDNKVQLDAIIKNTALPEIIKMQGSEQFMALARQNVYGKIQTGVGDYFRNYVNQTIENVGKQVRDFRDQFSSALQAGSSAIDTYSMMQEFDDGSSGRGIGSILGKGAAHLVGNRLGGAINRQLSKNQRVNSLSARSRYLSRALPEKLAGLREDTSYKTGWRGMVQNAMESILPNRFRRSTELTEPGINGLSFDSIMGGGAASRRPKEDVTHGYLSLILQSLESARLGRPVNRVVYNEERSQFTNEKTKTQDIARSVLGDETVKLVRSNTASMVDRMDLKGDLSPEARESLMRTFVKEADRGASFDPARFATGEIGYEGSPEVRDELLKFMSKRYGVGPDGTIGNTAEYYNRASLDMSSFRGLRNSMPDVYENIHRIINSGGIDALRSLGILVRSDKDPRKETINYDFIANRLGGNEWDIPDEELPEEASGRRRKERRGGRPRRDRSELPPTPATLNVDAAALSAGFADHLNKSTEQITTVVKTTGESLVDAILQSSGKGELISILEVLNKGIPTYAGEGSGGGSNGNGKRGIWERFKNVVGKTGRAGVDATGSIIRGYGKAFGNMMDAGTKLIRGGVDVGVGMARRIFTTDKIVDIFTRNRDRPSLRAELLKAGEYFDAKTKQVIKTLNDIKGDVIDKDGNIVLTMEEIKDGLFTRAGKRIRIPGLDLLRKGVASLFGAQWALLKSPLTIGKKIKDGVFNWLRRPIDIYVGSETSPRLLAVIMKNGGYFDKATGKPILKPTDIAGEVVDASGNVVLSSADIQEGIHDVNGKPIQGVLGKLGSAVRSIASRAYRFGKGIVDAGVASARAMMKGAGAVLKAPLNFLRGRRGEKEASGDKAVVKRLDRIYDLLNDRLPGNKRFRAGSWQERLSNKRSPKKVMDEVKKASDGNPLLKYLMMFGGAVMSGFAWLKSKFGGLIELLGKKRALDAATDGLDDLGDTRGRRRRGPRGRGGWIRRGLRSAGRFAGRALPRLAIAGGTMLSGMGSALAAAGSAAMTGLATLAGAITAPVVLGVAAVAAVGAAGYFAYKYFKGKPDTLQRLRLLQYGFSASDSDALKKVLEMEGFLLPYVSTRSNEVSLGNFKTEELLTRLAIDGQEERGKFTEWFQQRGRAVFLRNVGALKQIAPSVSLLEVDDKLTKEQAVDFANASRFPEGDPAYPYRYAGEPFAGISVTDTTKEISREMGRISRHYRINAKKRASAVAPIGEPPVKTPGAEIAAAVGKDGTVTRSLGSTPTTKENYQETTGSSGQPGITVKNWTPGRNRLLDDLTAVRMKVYGLSVLDVNQVNALTAFETNLYDKVIISTKGEVTIDLSPDDVYKANATLFGRDPSDPADKAEWISWYTLRFLPVFAQYVKAIKALGGNITPGSAWKSLKVEDMLSISELLKGMATEGASGSVSVWTVAISPFPGNQVNTDVKSVDSNLLSMRTQIRNTTYAESKPGGKGNASVGEQIAAQANQPTSRNATTFKAEQDAIRQQANKWGGSTPSFVTSTQPKAGTIAQQVMGKSAGGMPIGPIGQPISQPGNGTGGDINKVPMPTGDGSWEAMKNTIVAAASMAGVDPGLMASMAAIESGFRASVKAGTSSAAGLYQFIDDTWIEMLRRYGGKYGIAANTPKSDPRANALMGAEYLKENQERLESGLGRPVTAGDLYLAHFLGGGGALRILKAPAGDPAVQYAGTKAAQANKSIFYKDGNAVTVGELANWANRKVEQAGGRYAADAKRMASLLTGPDKPTQINPGSEDGGAAFEGTKAAASVAQQNAAGQPTPAAAPVPTGMGTTNGVARSSSPAETQEAPPTENSSGLANISAPSPTGEPSPEVVASARQTEANNQHAQAMGETADKSYQLQLKQREIQEGIFSSLNELLDLVKRGALATKEGEPAINPDGSTTTSAGNRVSQPPKPKEPSKATMPVSMKRTAFP